MSKQKTQTNKYHQQKKKLYLMSKMYMNMMKLIEKNISEKNLGKKMIYISKKYYIYILACNKNTDHAIQGGIFEIPEYLMGLVKMDFFMS